MKAALIAGCVVLSVSFVASGAHAEPLFQYLPPAEYDKPYTGELIIKQVATEQDVRDACPGAAAAFDRNPQSHATACNYNYGTRCEIIIVSDKVFKALGLTYAASLRHELGHCNGWSKDHPGKIPTRVSAQ